MLPSVTAPAFGTTVDIQFREPSTILHRAQLSMNVSAISGLTGSVTSYPHFVPACYWFDRIEILCSNNVVQVLTGDEIFLKQQCFYSDEYRHMTNVSQGIYSSIVQRAAMAATTSTYVVDLGSWIQQNSPVIATNVHALTFRCVFKAIADVVQQSTLTGTPVATISQLYLMADVSRIDPGLAQAHYAALVKQPRLYPFQPCVVTQQSFASGTTSANVVLNSVVGEALWCFCVLRSLAGDREATFLPISSFNIQDSSGANINPATLTRPSFNAMHSRWAMSTYLIENSLGLTDNNSNAILYSFTKSPAECARHGTVSNSRRFQGNESVVLTFPSLAATSEVVVLTFLSGAVRFDSAKAVAVNF